MSAQKATVGDCTLYLGDCNDILPKLPSVDLIATDPLYGTTSLSWDRPTYEWSRVASRLLHPHGSMWLFGSMRSLFNAHPSLLQAGWQYAQDLVWEKHNGSNFHADRFRRVHEHLVQYYRREHNWSDLVKNVQTTPDATARTIRRKKRPRHMGEIDGGHYASEDGGPRLQRSVIFVRSCHGHAVHPTQKPTDLVELTVLYSSNPGAIVCDPFMGSGTTGVVCQHRGRRFIGIEKNPEYFEAACRRIEHAQSLVESNNDLKGDPI